MKKILSHVALRLVLMNFCVMTISASTADSLSRTTPGQAALELSRISQPAAAGLLSQMNPGIVAKIISPAVMEPSKAAAILNYMQFGLAARILAPAVTEPGNAAYIWDEMRKQAPEQSVKDGIMHGMDTGSAAGYLVTISSNDAANLLYRMNAGLVACILAPTVTMPSNAHNILSAVTALNPAPAQHFFRAVGESRDCSGDGDSGSSGIVFSSHCSQGLGVAAGDDICDAALCVIGCQSVGNDMAHCVEVCVQNNPIPHDD